VPLTSETLDLWSSAVVLLSESIILFLLELDDYFVMQMVVLSRILALRCSQSMF